MRYLVVCILALFLSGCVSVCPDCAAQDVGSLINTYYNGLSEVLENTMSKPDDTVTKLGLYVLKEVELIRLVQDALHPQKTAVKTVEDAQESVLVSRETIDPNAPKDPLPGQIRFEKALEAFLARNPHLRREIANMDLHGIVRGSPYEQK